MNIPDSYYGIPASEWMNYTWEIEFKGITLRGTLRFIKEAPSGAIVFAIGDQDEEQGVTVVVVAYYQKFRPILPEKSEDEEEESEEEWKRRIIQHDAMASGLNFLGTERGTIRFHYE